MNHDDRHFTILLAEGDAGAREAFGATLRGQGHCVLVAASGRQALDMAPTGAPDLVLLDLGASEAEGIATLRELRSQGQSVPVILLTEEVSIRGAREAMFLGAYDYIAKPVDLEFLTGVIEEALEALPDASTEAACVH
jgi:two-component system, NtrC family, response regulator AtoC